MRRILFAAAAFVALISHAFAWTHGVSSSFNGGKSQIGVNFLQTADDYAFMNGMKGAQEWAYADNSGSPDPTELDTNGYPIPGSACFTKGGVFTIFYVPLQTERPGNYVATWNGQNVLRTGMTATVLTTATFTGSVTAGILTAGAPSGGTIQKGMPISTIGGIIGDQISGTAGQAGTYFVTGLTTASSQSMTITGGSKTSTGSGRYVFSPGTDYRFNIGFSSATTTPSDLKVFHVDDEDEINQGQILGKKFRQNWAFTGAGVIRFGDWQPMNTTNVTTWATRKPVNYVFYAGQEYRASLWGGVTTNVGNDYTAPITPSGWPGLVDKAQVIVKFNASASSDTVTLNVAGTGAIPVKNWGGGNLSVGANTRPVANLFAALTYDSVLNVWMKVGGDNASGNSALQNGVPPEVMLTVATKVGAHPWVSTPYLAGDPFTDYMTSLATYFRDNGPAWMIPRYEGTNELWNSAFGFYGFSFASNKSLAYWGVSDYHNWYGKEVSLLGQAISAVYSGNRSRYQVIAGVQTATACVNSSCGISTSGTSGSNARLTSASWIASGPAQSGYSNAAGIGEAYRWVTHTAAANYTNPSRYYTLQELIDGYAYVVTNAGNPTAQNALADAYVATLAGAAGGPFNTAYVQNANQNWCNWAASNWGGSINLKCTDYEGGYSPDYNSAAWTSPITGATAANPSVLTLATTSNSRYSGGSALSGNPSVAGMTLSIPMTITNVTQAASAVVTVSGFNIADVGRAVTISGFSVSGGTGMTQLNGSRTITAVSGQDITLNVDSTSFTPYVSGGTMTLTTVVAGVAGNSITTDLNGVGRTYSSGLTASYVSSGLYTNTLRWAGKFRPELATQTTASYAGLAAISNFEFPSHFLFSAASINNIDNRLSGGVIGGQVWGLWDQSVYATPYSTAVDAIRAFNLN